ncbi:MAG: GPP34 family phosphoprotein [Bacteroidales bacterium]|nr:GPP34 family phosphoprotein [Bacteroidales bacterium]
MELSLKEKFVILAYDPTKGNNLASNYIGYGIAGAMLLELAGMKKISIDNKKIKLLDSHKTGDDLLDHAIEIIRNSSKPFKVKALIGKIQNKPAKYKKPIINGLVKKRYLRKVHKKFLIFPYKRYPSANPGYRNNLVEYVRRLVLRKTESDSDIPFLVGLAGACRFSGKFFRTKEERKTAKTRIKEIVKESEVDQAIDETIKAVQAAVMAAVITSAALTSSSG